jgi:CubicO group peptidase (beta-lactamase class C family)
MKRLLALFVAALPLLAAETAGPVFRPGGPDAAKYGQAENYPKGPATHNDPDVQKHAVGASSHFDELFPTHKVAHGPRVWNFRRAAAPPEIRYDFEGKRYTLNDFLDRIPVTGLLIARDDTILTETYQYARTDRDRLTAASMTKTFISMLMGIAIDEHRIKSAGDPASAYVPALKRSPYGQTPLRELLLMSSGVALDEEAFWKDSFKPGADIGQALAKSGTRIAPIGTRFRYSSGDSEVLTTALRRSVGIPLSLYLSEKIWSPIGAESDASWAVESADQEIGPWGFNAVLRDYARFGRLLAFDGAWNGKQLIPKQWVIDATTTHMSEPQVSPGNASHYYGYGYQIWILPGDRRMFAMIGAEGQYVFVDPKSKLVLVQTAVRLDDQSVASAHSETLALWQAVVKQFG